MPGYTYPVSLPRQPRSTLRRPRRDFDLTAGDDVTLEITVHIDDSGAGTDNVTGSQTTWTVYDDSSTAILTITGTIVNAPTGRINVVLASADTADLGGRYAHSLQVEFANGQSTVVTGMVHIHPVAGDGASSAAGLMEAGYKQGAPLDVGALTATGVTVSGAVDIGAGLTVDGATTLGTTLSVAGASTLTGNVTAGGALSVAKATTLSSTLSVAGAVTMASTLNVTGPITSSDGLSGARLRVNYGSLAVTGVYSDATAPLAVHGTLTRVVGPSAPAGRRIVNRIHATDFAAPVNSANQGGSISVLDIVDRLGATGGNVADSWDGSRNILRITLDERNAPASSLTPVLGSVIPTTNVAWFAHNATQSYGGTSAEFMRATGSHFLTYGIIALRAGAKNLTNHRFGEYGLYMVAGASTRIAYGQLYNVIALEGEIPSEAFTALRAQRNGRATPGWRRFVGLGGLGYAGVDPIHGRAIAFEGSHADPIPQAEGGVDIRDVKFTGDAISFPHGAIQGGEHDDIGTGALRVGTGYFRRSATGATIEARGYRGRPSGYVFEYGVDLDDANPIVPVRNNSLGDDDYGGTYRFYSIDIANNRFLRAEVINPPVAYGSAPGAPIPVRLRENSTGRVGFVQSGVATTTSHPSPLTATTNGHYVGRYLVYYTGAAAGERRLITGHDATTGVLTTAAFSTVPTAEINVVQNPKFLLPLPTLEDTIVNSWQYTKNGGTGTLVRTTNPERAVLTGDGTNAVSMDQQVTLPAATDCRVFVAASGGYWIKVGTTRGASDLLSVFVPTRPPGEDGTYDIIPVDFPFFTAGTSAWIRIENADLVPATVRSVFCADVVAGSSILLGVRAGVEAAELTLDHVWTEMATLSVQPAGGGTNIGGATDVAGNFSVATSKFTVAAASGNTSVAGTLGVTGALTASSTLAATGSFAVNTTKFTVDASTGNTSVAGTLGVTGALTASSTLSSSGNFAVNTNKFTVTASNGNTAIAGTLDVTGTATFGTINLAALASGPSYDDDAAAAAGGVGIGDVYLNGNFMMVRRT